MNITPIDIQQKRFHVVFRGYERTDVELFLDMVRDEMETLVRELAEMRDFRQSYDQRLRELNEREEIVKNTLMMTQKLMQDQKDSANRAADAIIREAEARRLQLLSTAQDEKAKLDSEIQELRRRKHHFLQDIRKVIEMHREMVAFEENGDRDIKKVFDLPKETEDHEVTGDRDIKKVFDLQKETADSEEAGGAAEDKPAPE